MKLDAKTKTTFSLAAVVAKDRGIGYGNKLLFDLPQDLKHFKDITMGHTVIMGYNTYKSIGKALPGRRNIVLCEKLTRLIDAQVCRSISDAIVSCSGETEVFFIGGASIYQQTIGMADKLYLTLVDAIKPADTFFPDYSEFTNVKKTGEGTHNGVDFSYLELTR